MFKEFEVQDVIPTPAQIKEAFNLKTKGEKKENHEEKQKVELDFMKVFNEFVAECSKQNDWSSSTLKKFATVKNTFIHLTLILRLTVGRKNISMTI